MKKSFALTDPKISSDRIVESIKGEIRKYLKRERKKKLPEGVDFWDFDCRFGSSTEDALDIHVAEISKCIEAARAQGFDTCYIEILAKHGKRTRRDAANKPAESD